MASREIGRQYQIGEQRVAVNYNDESGVYQASVFMFVAGAQGETVEMALRKLAEACLSTGSALDGLSR